MATIDSLTLKATPLTTDTIELNDGQKATLGSLPVSTATQAALTAHNDDTGAHGQTAVGRAVLTAVSESAARAAIGAAADADVVKLSGNQTIAGDKTFTGTVTIPTLSGNDAAFSGELTLPPLVRGPDAFPLVLQASDSPLPQSIIMSSSADASVEGANVLLVGYASVSIDAPSLRLPPNTDFGDVVSSTELSHLGGVTSAIQTQLNAKASTAALTAHISDPTAAHAASAISATPTGGLAGTDVAAQIGELESNKLDADGDGSALTGLTKSQVGLGNVDNTSDATKNAAVATLTNKDLSSATNTYRAATTSATGAALLASAGTTSISAAGNTDISLDGGTQPNRVITITAAAGAGDYTHTLTLSSTNAHAGSFLTTHIDLSASNNGRIQLRNLTSGGTLLGEAIANGTARRVTFRAIFDGTDWSLVSRYPTSEVFDFRTDIGGPAGTTGTIPGPYTWTTPVGAQRADFILSGAGSGGGSGRRGAAGTNRYGGGGGASGGLQFLSKMMEGVDTYTVTLGIGGAGGAAQTVDDTDGNNGAVGSPATKVEGSTFRAIAGGGNASQGGKATATNGGAPGAYGYPSGISGGAGGLLNGGESSNFTTMTSAGGSGGGGVDSSNAFGIGYRGGVNSIHTASSYAGNANSAGQDGSIIGPIYIPNAVFGWAGGSGGAGNPSGEGGDGAPGTGWGAGGGGGGASVNGFNSGAGGKGGDGIVRVTFFY